MVTRVEAPVRLFAQIASNDGLGNDRLTVNEALPGGNTFAGKIKCVDVDIADEVAMTPYCSSSTCSFQQLSAMIPRYSRATEQTGDDNSGKSSA